MKEIEVGEEYAAATWAKLDHVDLLGHFGRPGSKPPQGKDWARSWREALCELSDYRAKRVRVIEKGVQVGHYARPGVLVQELDKETGEPDGEPVPMRAVQLAMSWERLRSIYLDVMDAYEQEQADEKEARERRQRESQEAHARDWMAREFAAAREDLEAMVEIGAIVDFGEAQVKLLVEQRNPDGNPYLTGERTAY